MGSNRQIRNCQTTSYFPEQLSNARLNQLRHIQLHLVARFQGYQCLKKILRLKFVLTPRTQGNQLGSTGIEGVEELQLIVRIYVIQYIQPLFNLLFFAYLLRKDTGYFSVHNFGIEANLWIEWWRIHHNSHSYSPIYHHHPPIHHHHPPITNISSPSSFHQYIITILLMLIILNRCRCRGNWNQFLSWLMGRVLPGRDSQTEDDIIMMMVMIK